MITFLLYNRKNAIEKLNKGHLDATIVYDDYKHKTNLKKHKGIKIATNIIVDSILAILGVVLILGLSDRFLNTSITGYQSLVVPTDSMSYKNDANPYLKENNLDNQIQPNDLVFVERLNSFDDIKLYDVICYRNELDIQIIHRVVEIHEDFFKTRGDAETSTDAMNITFDRVVGRYTNVRIPVIGNVIFFISSYYGLIAFGSSFIMLLAYWIVKDNMNKHESKRLNYLLDLIGDSKDFVIEAKQARLQVNQGHYVINNHDEKLQVEKDSTLKIQDHEIMTLKSEGACKENEKETHI